VFVFHSLCYQASGELKTRTEWHRVALYDQQLVEVVEKYVKKGRRLYLEGALQTRRWAGNDGNERFTTEVVLQRFRGEMVMLDSPEDRQASNNNYAAAAQDQAGYAMDAAAAAVASDKAAPTPQDLSQGLYGRVSAASAVEGDNGYQPYSSRTWSPSGGAQRKPRQTGQSRAGGYQRRYQTGSQNPPIEELPM